MSEKKILLGFEVASGESVYLPFHHTAFTGMTGLSGKTTANEAVSVRSGVRTLTFLTKRGEKAFQHSKVIPLFFKERSDWRYVESLIEAELTEDQRFNRSWIITVCRGAKSLRDVWNNVKEALPKARKDSLSQRVYTCLNAYFEIIIPSIEKYDFSDKLQIGKEPGSYVMDFIGMPEAVQAVFIRSALEEILDHETDVWPTIPEAWKFIGAIHTPVTEIAIRIIKQGYAVNILLFIDSQDIASINPKIRGQIDNWILGRQKYEHEIQRTLKAIPLPKRQKPKVEQIMTLKLGHFIAACRDWTKTVYVLPAGVPEEAGRKVALGEMTPEQVRDQFLSRLKEDEDLVWKEKFEEEKRKRKELENEFARQVERLSDLKAEEKIREVVKNNREIIDRLTDELTEAKEHLGNLGNLKNRLKTQKETIVKLLRRNKELEPLAVLRDALIQILPTSAQQTAPNNKTISLEHTEQVINLSHSEKTVEMDTTTQQGQILFCAINDLPKDGFTEKQMSEALKEHGWNISHSSLAPQLSSNLAKEGLLIKIPNTRPKRFRLPSKLKVNVEKEVKS